MIEFEGEWKADDEAEEEEPSGVEDKMPWLLLLLLRRLPNFMLEGEPGAEDVGDGESSSTKVSFGPEWKAALDEDASAASFALSVSLSYCCC